MSVSLATHRRPNLDLFTTSNILHRIVQDQVEEHVIPPQRTRYESVRIEVEVDGFVHVLEVGSGVRVSKGDVRGGRTRAPFSIRVVELETWWEV